MNLQIYKHTFFATWLFLKMHVYFKIGFMGLVFENFDRFNYYIFYLKVTGYQIINLVQEFILHSFSYQSTWMVQYLTLLCFYSMLRWCFINFRMTIEMYAWTDFPVFSINFNGFRRNNKSYYFSAQIIS